MKLKKALSLTIAASLAAVMSLAFSGCEWFSFDKRRNNYAVSETLGYTGDTDAWLMAPDALMFSDEYDLYLSAYADGYSGDFQDFLSDHGENTASVGAGTQKSVVGVEAVLTTPEGTRTNNGSGILYQRGEGSYYYIITNYHVVYDPNTENFSTLVRVVPHGTEETFTAVCVGGSMERDIAVLYASVGSSDVSLIRTRTADPIGLEAVYVTGNADGAGVDTVATTVANPCENVDVNKADGSGEKVRTSMTTVNVSADSGYSGGGLFDRNGKLIGVLIGEGSGSIVSYAIPYSLAISTAQNIICQNPVVSSEEEDNRCKGALVARLGTLEAGQRSAETGAGGYNYMKESVKLTSIDRSGPFAQLTEGAEILEVEVRDLKGNKLFHKKINRKYELEAVLMNVRKNNTVVLTIAGIGQVSAEYTRNAHFTLSK